MLPWRRACAAATTPKAAAMPMAGAPRTCSVRIAFHTARTSRVASQRHFAGKRVWSTMRMWPGISAGGRRGIHSIVRTVFMG